MQPPDTWIVPGPFAEPLPGPGSGTPAPSLLAAARSENPVLRKPVWTLLPLGSRSGHLARSAAPPVPPPPANCARHCGPCHSTHPRPGKRNRPGASVFQEADREYLCPIARKTRWRTRAFRVQTRENPVRIRTRSAGRRAAPRRALAGTQRRIGHYRISTAGGRDPAMRSGTPGPATPPDGEWPGSAEGGGHGLDEGIRQADKFGDLGDFLSQDADIPAGKNRRGWTFRNLSSGRGDAEGEWRDPLACRHWYANAGRRAHTVLNYSSRDATGSGTVRVTTVGLERCKLLIWYLPTVACASVARRHLALSGQVSSPGGVGTQACRS